MYTSFMNTGNQSMMGTSSSKGWRNRNHVVAPPSLNELTTQESTALMSLSQRILDGFAVVSSFVSDLGKNLNQAHCFFNVGEACHVRYSFHCVSRRVQTGVHR